MSTRTPIKFGAIMEAVFAERLSHYERAFTETTSQYLFYGYRRYLVGDLQGFLLVQASRGAGRVAFELAVSQVGSYPYHRLRDFPSLGAGGFRERLPFILKGYDHSEEYTSPEGLTKLLRAICKDVDPAMNRLLDRAVPRINVAYKAWQPLYAEWVEAERAATAEVPARYPGLADEKLAFDLLDEMLGQGTFDRYLGPLKYRYRNQDFFNCHLYLLAKGLEFLEPPPLEDPQPPPPAEVPAKALPPLDDPTPALMGRLPQEMAVELSMSTSVRLSEYAFLHSLAAAEALLVLDEWGRPTVGGQQISSEVEAYGTEAPAYEAPVVEQPKAPVMPRKGPLPRPKPRDDDDDDPLAALESRLGLR